MEDRPGIIFSLYAAGIFFSCLLYAFRLKRTRNSLLCAALSAVFGAALAAVFAKVFFLLHNLGLDARNWTAEELLRFSWEELSFTGGCIGFSLGVLLAARLTGIPGKAALDAFSVPGCLLIAFARMAEAGMSTVGQGDMPSFLPAVFPFAVMNSWGMPNLAVFFPEALAALAVGAWILVTEKRKKAELSRFEEACFLLCSLQLFLEMLTVNYWIPFVISFIHLDQVLCAIILLTVMIRRCVRMKKAGPVIVTVLLLGLNALMQFVQDKPYLFPIPESVDAGTLAVIVFALISAGLVLTWTLKVRKVSPVNQTECKPA